MKPTTFNQKLILYVLSEQLLDCGDNPPYSASSVRYALEQVFNYNWGGIYECMWSVPSMSKVRRTLRDLWHGGAIVGTRVKEDSYDDSLLDWVIGYQIAEAAQSKRKKSKRLHVAGFSPSSIRVWNSKPKR